MSLARPDIDSVHEVFEHLRLPNSSSTTINVYQIRSEGHFYNNPNILGLGNSSMNVGDLGRMSSHNKRTTPLPDKSLLSPPASVQDATDLERGTSPFIARAPSPFEAQVPGFFRPGRYFKIWAMEGDNVDIEIHDKEFILLDTKNNEGPGILVKQYDSSEHKGSFNRNHVLLQDARAPKPSSTAEGHLKKNAVSMDEGDDPVAENTFVELDHTYNIPFGKYKCIDYGVMNRTQLKELRRLYVEWLKYQWDLG